jgi:hypothetical protein
MGGGFRLMSLLHDLYAEESELRRLLAAAQESQDNVDFPVSSYEIEGIEIRLGRVRQAIDSIEQPFDVGGWEDH